MRTKHSGKHSDASLQRLSFASRVFSWRMSRCSYPAIDELERWQFVIGMHFERRSWCNPKCAASFTYNVFASHLALARRTCTARYSGGSTALQWSSVENHFWPGGGGYFVRGRESERAIWRTLTVSTGPAAPGCCPFMYLPTASTRREQAQPCDSRYMVAETPVWWVPPAGR